MSSNCAVILAAGQGTRMKSAKPKVLAEVLFKPMIDWVTDAATHAGIDDICLVTGFKREMIDEHFGGRFETVEQTELLGTGHAVMAAADFIKAHIPGNVLVINGDAPLIPAETLKAALDFHIAANNAATVITAKVENPFGYGRIIRSRDGKLKKIVEEKEASQPEKIVNEVNSGAYWFTSSVLLESLEGIIEKHDRKNDRAIEYHITDAVEVILEKGLNAVAYDADSPDIVLGANDRAQLWQLNEIARRHILKKHMLNGVSIPCTDGVIIAPDVKIKADTQILPGTIIKGSTVIGEGCEIGPNSLLEDSVVGDNVSLNSVQCYSSEIKSGAHIGPFVRVRPGSVVGEGVKVGNFVELKNSVIGDRTSIAHLTYIGDSDVGSGVNFGCGCATANYDGKSKARTRIGDNAFIGCDTCLVAPVQVGDNAYTAAGSVITEDVPDNALAIARAKESVKKDWVKKKKPYRWQK